MGKLAVVGAFLATAAAAHAQAPAPAPQPPSPAPVWTVSAGYESFWLRDVASSGRPVDASPVSWQGEGAAVVATYDRDRIGRLHHFEGSFASTGRFSLESPMRTLPASPDDRARRLGGRYEYRRYPFRNVGVQGLDLGVGAEGNVEHLVLLHHFQPTIDLRTTVLNFGTAGVVAARLQRSRVDLQVAYGNGLSIGRGTSRHRGGDETSAHGWGGGWQTHLAVRAAIRVRPRTALVGSYLNSGEGRFSSHDPFTFGRSRLALGVTYER